MGFEPVTNRPKERHLVVTADDLGMSPVWDAAIFECADKGVVTSVTVVVGGTNYPHARRHLIERGLDHGVHLTLLGTAPVASPAEVASLLMPDGRLPATLSALARRWLVSPPRLREVAREWESQVRRAFDDGLNPSHLSGHYHLHLLPGMVQVVTDLARRFHIPWIRVLGDVAPRNAPLSVRGRAGALRAVSLPARVAIRRAGVGASRCHGAWAGGRLDLQVWTRILSELPSGMTEVVCHPGQGEAETRALTDPSLRRMIAARATLGGFPRVAAAHAG